MEERSRDLLILGMTYPTYSLKYWENACTGALDRESRRLVRLYPIPRRHLGGDAKFGEFQWITAKCRANPSDPRPESWLIHPESISLGETIPSSEPDRRVRLLEESPHFFESVEALRKSNVEEGTSLGIVRPASIDDVLLRRRSETERKEWMDKEQAVLSQERLPFERPPLPIDFPEMRFVVKWTDQRGEPFEMSLKTWGIHELYRKYRTKPDGRAKVKQAIWSTLDLKTKDVFMYLGTFLGHQRNFGLMGACSAAKHRQGSLALE